MGIVQRQGIIASIGNYLGVILGYLNMVIFYPNVLGANEFGLVRLLISTAFVLAQFGELGLGTAVIRFFPKFRESTAHKASLFSTVLFFASVANCILLVLLITFKGEVNAFFSEGSPLLSEYYSELVIMTIGVALSEVFYGIARSQLKNIAPVFVKELLLRLIQTTLIGAIYWELISFEQFIILFAFTYPMQGFVIASFLLLQGRLKLSLKRQKAQATPKDILNYSFFMALMKIPNNATVHIDLIMLGALTNLESVAIYSIAGFLANLIMVPSRTISQITLPLISRDLEKNNLQKVELLLEQSISSLIFVSGVLFLLINANIKLIASFTKIDGIESLALLTVILSFGKLINASSGVSWGIINQSKYFKKSFIISLIFVSTAIVSNYILIPQFGIKGAAIATAFTFMCYSLMKVGAIMYLFKINPLSITPILFILVICLMIAGLDSFYLANMWLDSILKTTIIIFISSILLLKTNLAPEIRDVFIRFLPN